MFLSSMGERGREEVKWPTIRILRPIHISITICSGRKLVYNGTLGSAIPNVALSATVYWLRHPGKLCLPESVNSGEAHLYTTLNLHCSTMKFLYWWTNHWCFLNVLWYENWPKIGYKTANVNVNK